MSIPPALPPVFEAQQGFTKDPEWKLISKLRMILLCDINGNHFLPSSKMVEKLWAYSDEEQERIASDFEDIRQHTFKEDQPHEMSEYVVTVGLPFSGKSILMAEELKGDLRNHVYIGPDSSYFSQMTRTYLRDQESHVDIAANEEKWRKASEFISDTLMAIALKEKYAIAHGSTIHMEKMFEALKKTYHYGLTILHLTCEEEVWKESWEKREGSRVEPSAEQDFQDEAKIFAERLPSYLKVADDVCFFFREKKDEMVEWARSCGPDMLQVKVDQGEKIMKRVREVHDKQVGEGAWDRIFKRSVLWAP